VYVYYITFVYINGYARASGGDKIRHDRCSRFTAVGGITVIILIIIVITTPRCGISIIIFSILFNQDASNLITFGARTRGRLSRYFQSIIRKSAVKHLNNIKPNVFLL